MNRSNIREKKLTEPDHYGKNLARCAGQSVKENKRTSNGLSDTLLRHRGPKFGLKVFLRNARKRRQTVVEDFVFYEKWRPSDFISKRQPHENSCPEY